MSVNLRVQAQATVILGFALSAVSGLISYFTTITSRGYYFNSFREIVIPVLNPLTAIAALFAWWWLTQIEARDEVQRATLQLAYIGFAVQYLLMTTLFLFLVTPFHTFGGIWGTSDIWLQMIGSFVAAIGLILLSRLRGYGEQDSTAPDSGVVESPLIQ